MQKTAYEMLISDWSLDVLSSDLVAPELRHQDLREAGCLLQAVDAEAGNRRHAVAADHQRRLEPRQAVDQPAAQQGGRQVAAALDEEAGDAAGAEQREGGVERDMAVGVGRNMRPLDAGLPIGLERSAERRVGKEGVSACRSWG